MKTRTLKTLARDNHGHEYDVEIQKERGMKPVLRIIGTPGSWYLETLRGHRGAVISLDLGQDWDCINFDEIWAEVEPPVKLGKNQRAILRSLLYRPSSLSSRRAADRPYPGGGWVWDNHSGTVRLLDSLVRRDLAEMRGRQYFITEAGREYLEAGHARR